MVAVLALVSLASCATTSKNTKPHKRSKEYFAESEYGVKASPRLYTGRNIPKGGGREIVGKPYKVKGKWYVPKEDKRYNKVGLASWYGAAFHGRMTANGEVYDSYHLSAAHPTFPLPSYARVTNTKTGDSVIVRVNDRGPYHPGRIIDVSEKAAELLAIKRDGTAKVRVQYVGKARMDGHDMAWLMASYRRKGDRGPAVEPQIATGVMVASNETSIGLPASETTESAATALNRTTTAGEDPFATVASYPELPEYGPIPAERPEMIFNIAGLDQTLVTGYAEEGTAGTISAFDAVLADDNGGLTPEKIRASVLKRSLKQN